VRCAAATARAQQRCAAHLNAQFITANDCAMGSLLLPMGRKELPGEQTALVLRYRFAPCRACEAACGARVT
jgi:hypothetical protein